MLNVKDPSPTVLKQKQCMEYILRSVLEGTSTKDNGKACDVPLPRGEQLAALQSFWRHVDVLVVDEVSFVAAWMLERMDAHLRLARNMPLIPFGGVLMIFMGDLHQLPPPSGWGPFTTCMS